MNLIISILFAFIIGIFDGHFSVFAAGIVITLACRLHLLSFGGNDLARGKRLMAIIIPVYFIAALIFSYSFDASHHFIVSDPSRYIQSYCFSNVNYYNFDQLRNCYLELSDNNALYNSSVLAVCTFANNYLGGSSVLFMTLIQTLFGLMSIMMLYRILVRQFGFEQAFKYSLLFAFGSHFLFYSSVIIRDITIVYFYLVSTAIIISKFEIRNLIVLIICILITWGIRLYSGLFLFVFLGYYMYIISTTDRSRKISLVVFIPALLVLVGVVMSFSIFDQTVQEINDYSELSFENSGDGMVSKLMKLPPGISQIALLLFAMVKPFPPFSVISIADSFSSFVMSSVFTFNSVFWFCIFYVTIIGMLFKGFWGKMNFSEKLLLLVVLVFLMANTAHADVRRMMPVFPILYICFIKMKEESGSNWMKQLTIALLVFYLLIGFVM